jgi:hypothetical protein
MTTKKPGSTTDTDVLKRPFSRDDSAGTEGAVNDDATDAATRADPSETSEYPEQAVLPASPVRTKRANRTKKPKADQRAVAAEESVSPEHAESREPPASDEHAISNEPPVLVERTIDQSRLALKRKVRMMYDLQRLRMQAAGRTLTRPTKPDSVEKVEIFLHESDLMVLERRAADLRRVEKEALHDVEAHLKTISFYRDVLSDKELYKGVGPTMAGVILSEFDIRRADTVSKMWKFAGLTSTPAHRCKKCFTLMTEDEDGKGKRAELEAQRQQAVLEVTRLRENGLADEFLDAAVGKAMRLKNEVERTAFGVFTHRGKVPKGCQESVGPGDVIASGEAPRPRKGEKLPYNAFLRVKLVGVLGPVLIKVGSPWRKTYDDYKHRLVSKGWGKNDGHRHAAAIRYMVKMLLLDIHRRWREHEGLTVRPPYHEEKLGMAPHSGSLPVATPKAAHVEDEVDDERDTYEADIQAELEQLAE